MKGINLKNDKLKKYTQNTRRTRHFFMPDSTIKIKREQALVLVPVKTLYAVHKKLLFSIFF
jgi:hypothetical protein